MKIPLQDLEVILQHATESALGGTLQEETRVQLLQLAMQVAADEFYYIESEEPGVVSTETLIFLQQISLLCSDNIDTDTLMDSMGMIVEALNGPEEVDGGGSLITVG